MIDEREPRRRRLLARRWRWTAAVVAVALAGTAPAPARAEAASRFHPRTEWIVDGALAAAWLSMIPAFFASATLESGVGPSFGGPEDVAVLEGAAASGVIGRAYLGEEHEIVPDATLGWMIAGTVGGALLVAGGLAPWIDDEEHAGMWFAEQGLAALAGMVHAMLGTLMITEVAKVTVGRLRPDFAERADRYYCNLASVPATYRPRCGALEAAGELGEAVDEAVLLRGRRSFWSGHASLSFAAATYGALLVGGRMVWGRSSNGVTRALGILLQGAALAGAGFVAASRVGDGVHHVEDVVVGSAVGITLACLGYFLHFDGSGEVRRGVSLTAGPTASGLALAGTF